MNDAEIAEVEEHLGLGWGQVCFGVGKAELEGAQHKEEGEDVNSVHVELIVRL